MKQKDVLLIVVVGFISAIAAFLISRTIFSSTGEGKQSTEVVDVITPDFPEPPPKYFNTNSINPTQLITIGGNPNPNPFNKPQ